MAQASTRLQLLVIRGGGGGQDDKSIGFIQKGVSRCSEGTIQNYILQFGTGSGSKPYEGR